MSSSKFTKEALKIVVAQICQEMGWAKTKQIPFEVLVDLLHKYLENITRGMQHYAEHFGKDVPVLDALGLAFCDMGVKVEELKEFAAAVDSRCTLTIPNYPLRQEPRLNFLDSNSREAKLRPTHIFDYLPPMFPKVNKKIKERKISIPKIIATKIALNPERFKQFDKS